MSKKIQVLNSPWNRQWERPSDCARWIAQGHAELSDNTLKFSPSFVASVNRAAVECDPTGHDDGTQRRWATRDSAGMPVKQLLPVQHVGTGKSVGKVRDLLVRRQYRRDKGKSVHAGGAA